MGGKKEIKDDKLAGIVDWYQESIIEMVKEIKKKSSIKMLYGFAKGLYQDEKSEE